MALRGAGIPASLARAARVSTRFQTLNSREGRGGAPPRAGSCGKKLSGNGTLRPRLSYPPLLAAKPADPAWPKLIRCPLPRTSHTVTSHRRVIDHGAPLPAAQGCSRWRRSAWRSACWRGLPLLSLGRTAASRRSTTALLGQLRRRAIRSSGRGLAIIPGKSNRKEQRFCIPGNGRQRRVAESFFTTIKRYRLVNTRYDRLAEILMVFVSLESLDDWGRSWIGPPWLCLRDVPLDLRFLPFPCTPTSNSRKPCPNL